MSSSKSGAFSLSGKSSFSNGTLIGLLPVAIATVRRFFLQSCCFKLSWPEERMVANGNKHQLNILPKINVFSLLGMGRILTLLKQKKNKRYIYIYIYIEENKHLFLNEH